MRKLLLERRLLMQINDIQRMMRICVPKNLPNYVAV